MENTLTHTKLTERLSLIRKIMTDEALFPPSNLYFLDSRSFYHYYKKCPCGEITLEAALKEIEGCIPLAITDESLKLFISACQKKEPPFADSFLESSKADFLLLVQRTAEDEEMWQSVVTLCSRLRISRSLL